MSANPYSILLKSIAQRGIDNQKIHKGDFYRDGLLICGKCREQRQKILEYDQENENGKEIKRKLKVACECRCERNQREFEEREEKRKKEMEQIENLKALSLMDEKFSDACFENLKATKYNQRNLKLCKRYATAFDEMLKKAQGLLMWGNPGTGKSYSAAAIANYLLEHKVPVIMTSFTIILKLIDSNKSEEASIARKLGKAKLVIFDDLGAERDTDYAIEKVYNIIDERYRKKLPMILTTNMTLEEMKRETDIRYARIYDRIFETCYPMQFTGPSWRKITASQRFNEMEKFLEGDE